MVAFAGAAASNAQTAIENKPFFVTACILILSVEKLQPAVPGQRDPWQKQSIDRANKHEKSQGHYHHRYMVTRAILTKACWCKPNRRSREYPDFKQGSKLLKINYFPSGCIGVGFSTSRCRTRSVTVGQVTPVRGQ